MTMSPKIHSSFWKDDDVGGLTPDCKLAFLWLLTNGQTNNVGFLRVSRREFVHDTGLPEETLVSLLKSLPRAFVWEESDGRLLVWIRHYIQHQWTVGQIRSTSLIHTNLLNLIAAMPEHFQKTLASDYKTLASDLSKLLSEDKTPQDPSKGLQVPRTEQSRAEQSIIPVFEEVKAFAEAWPGEPASGTGPMNPEWVKQWFARQANKAIGFPLRWQLALVADWRAGFRNGQMQGKAIENPVAVRIGLERQIAALDEDLDGHIVLSAAEPTDSERADFEAKKKKRAELKQRLKELANERTN